jgi:hypothetical protein
MLPARLARAGWRSLPAHGSTRWRGSSAACLPAALVHGRLAAAPQQRPTSPAMRDAE